MRQAIGTIERAYQLADAGSCRTVEEIARKLASEGYESPQAHLAGKSVRVELRRRIKARRDAQAGSAAAGTDRDPVTI
ncbi:MAG TPA: hypothetical protein VGC10_00480 [Sphingomonas sp.]